MARAHTVNQPRGGKVSGRTRCAVGYARRSTDRQEQSIPDQKKAIETYAAEQGLRLDRFYIDDAISGTSSVGRKAFQSLIEDAKQHACDFGFIIVYDVKRFGRVDNDEAGYYRHLLRTHGVTVLYVSEGFTGDGTDDLLRPVKQWQARQESKDLAKVAIRGQLSKATPGSVQNGEDDLAVSTSRSASDSGREKVGGWWMGGAPPFGYDLKYESQSGDVLFVLRYLRDGRKEMFDAKGKLIRTLDRGESIAVSRRDRCRLIPSDKQRADIVREIFRMYVNERRGLTTIANALNRKGIPSPRGKEWAKHYSGKWSMTTIRAILLNPVYSGDMVWNRRTDARFYKISNGQAVERGGGGGMVARRLEPNDERDWIVHRDAHPAIVSRRIWNAAAKRRDENSWSRDQRGVNPRTGLEAGAVKESSMSRQARVGARAKFLLSGLCICGRCGSRYEGHAQWRQQRDEDGKRIKVYQYACGGYIRHGKSMCTLGGIRKEVLEEAVIDAVLKYYERYRGPEGEQRIREALEEQVGSDQQQIAAEVDGLTTRLQEIETTLNNLVDNLTTANREHVDRRIVELDHEKNGLDSRLERIQHRTMSREELAGIADEMQQFARGLDEILRSATLEQRNTALQQCIEGITIRIGDPSSNHQLRVRHLPVLVDHQSGTECVVIAVPSTPHR